MATKTANKEVFGIVPFTKAYEKENSEGETERYVEAIVSDDGVDLENDQMTLQALELMKEHALGKGPIYVRGLIENHRATFAFGEVVGAEIIKASDGLNKLLLIFKLDYSFPYSKKLFESVISGNNKYQLSIGGFVDFKSKDAVRFVKDSAGKIIRQILKIVLEHIAVTPFNMAANPRTAFVSALSKSLGEKEEVIIEEGEKIDWSKYNLFKTVFKTKPDYFDGHFHIVNPAMIDENGNGVTENAIGIHPLSREHYHEVKDFLVKNVKMELENPSELEMQQWNDEAGYDSPVSKGIFYSRHSSYGPASMSVSKEKIDNIKTLLCERKELPDSAFAIQDLRMLAHHYKNVENPNDNLTVNIELLKENIDYVNSSSFLENFGLTEEEIKCYKKEAREHLLKHLEELEIPREGVFKRLANKLRGVTNMKLEALYKQFEKLSGLEKISDENIGDFLKARNSIDLLLKESGVKIPDSADNKSQSLPKEEIIDELEKKFSEVFSEFTEKLKKSVDKFDSLSSEISELKKGVSAVQSEQLSLKQELEKSSSGTVPTSSDNSTEPESDSDSDEDLNKEQDSGSINSLMKRLSKITV